MGESAGQIPLTEAEYAIWAQCRMRAYAVELNELLARVGQGGVRFELTDT
jgi:hypothetical protein